MYKVRKKTFIVTSSSPIIFFFGEFLPPSTNRVHMNSKIYVMHIDREREGTSQSGGESDGTARTLKLINE